MMHAWAFVAMGLASYYSRASSGPTRADGTPMVDSQHTCAMRTHDFGWKALLINDDNRRESWCIVDDYGPAEWTGRVIDVSPAVRRDLGFSGTAHVRVYRELPPPPVQRMCVIQCSLGALVTCGRLCF